VAGEKAIPSTVKTVGSTLESPRNKGERLLEAAEDGWIGYSEQNQEKASRCRKDDF
jgi:hypothetical protein